MIRHVVLFTWSADADRDRRSRSIEALRGLRETVGGMTALTVAEDVGLVGGTADAVLIADFPDVEAFHTYAGHPAHVAVLDADVRPFLAARSAVQYEL